MPRLRRGGDRALADDRAAVVHPQRDGLPGVIEAASSAQCPKIGEWIKPDPAPRREQIGVQIRSPRPEGDMAPDADRDTARTSCPAS